MRSSPAPILLVDDSADDLLLTEQLLGKAGVHNPILTACGGEEAIALLRPPISRLPFLILCDVRMPKVDGFDVLKWVRNQPHLTGLYFAMHTGGNVPADRARASHLGANEFLVKFPQVAQLRKIVHEAISASAPNLEARPESVDAHWS